jgi:hypothetical protein
MLCYACRRMVTHPQAAEALLACAQGYRSHPLRVLAAVNTFLARLADQHMASIDPPDGRVGTGPAFDRGNPRNTANRADQLQGFAGSGDTDPERAQVRRFVLVAGASTITGIRRCVTRHS